MTTLPGFAPSSSSLASIQDSRLANPVRTSEKPLRPRQAASRPSDADLGGGCCPGRTPGVAVLHPGGESDQATTQENAAMCHCQGMIFFTWPSIQVNAQDPQFIKIITGFLALIVFPPGS